MKKTKAGKTIVPKRIDKLIRELPKHNYEMTPSALSAGYAVSTSYKNHTDFKKAIANRLEEAGEIFPKDKYFNIEKLVEEYRKVQEQDRDMSAKLKAIAPILQKHGILPQENAQTVIIPTLNVIVREARPKLENESPSYRIIEPIEGTTKAPANDEE